MLKKILTLISMFMFLNSPVLATISCAPNGQAKAFPEAEGYGALTTGGRGGRVYVIANLNDSGTGSLRECIEANGPRICVFNIGGTVDLETPLSITNPNISILGQSGPVDGGGITLRSKGAEVGSWGNENGTLVKPALWSQANQVVVRHLRSRPGPSKEKTSGLSAVNVGNPDTPVTNNIFDHISASWGTDQTFTVWYGTNNLTIQNSIISEGLHCSTHDKTDGRTGCHSKGLHLGENTTGNISIHSNILASNVERNPLVTTNGNKPVEVINNVIHNAAHYVMVRNSYGSSTHIEVIANYFKQKNSPPDLTRWEIREYPSQGDTGPMSIFAQDNIGWHRTQNTQDNDLIVYPGSKQYLTNIKKANPSIPVTVISAQETYEQVLNNAGANIPTLDFVDKRIINEVENANGTWVDHPNQVGGWPNLSPGTSKPDNNNNDMPDEWEQYLENRGGEFYDTKDTDGDGYTDFEEYLNSTNINTPESGCAGSEVSPTPLPSIDLSFDHNGDERVDILDVIEIIKYIFR